MRCLRKITEEQQTASVYLSKENFDTLNDELNKNFNIEIKDLKDSSGSKKQPYKVRVLPPPRYLTVKQIKHNYTLLEHGYSAPIDFQLSELDLEKYQAVIYHKEGLAYDKTVKEENADHAITTVPKELLSVTRIIIDEVNMVRIDIFDIWMQHTPIFQLSIPARYRKIL